MLCGLSVAPVRAAGETAAAHPEGLRASSCGHCEPTGRSVAPPDDRLREARLSQHRHCERSEAIQNAPRGSSSGLLRRCAPRNDGAARTRLLRTGSIKHKRIGTHSSRLSPQLSHNATVFSRALSFGTSLERIAPESLTLLHFRIRSRNMSRQLFSQALDGVRNRQLRPRAASNFLKISNAPSRIRIERESMGFHHFIRHSGARRSREPGIHSSTNSAARWIPGPRLKGASRNDGGRGGHPTPVRMSLCSCESTLSLQGRVRAHSIIVPYYCVLATRGGVAVVMNVVASNSAGPSGVGTLIQNGTRMRVPASGANAISMLRWAARYLITGRSGM